MAFVVPVAVSIGASLLAGALRRNKTSSPVRDSNPPTLSQRGVSLPRVYGLQRVAPIVAGVFDRHSKKVKQGGGSGGGSQVTGYTYEEGAWHQLCVGPAYGLGSIRENGKYIFTDYVTRDDTPSGSTLQARDGSTFRVYWGERGQPVDNYLAKQIGVRSHWSYCCHVVWERKRLGGSANWPQLTYDVVCRVESSTLSGSAAWLDESGAGYKNNGVNPAHALWQVLTAQSPHGCGIAAYLLDVEAFEALGSLLEAEHMPLNTAAEDGMSAADFCAQLMQDYGFLLPQRRWLLSPKAVRPIDADDLPVLPADAIEQAPEQVEDLDPQAYTRRVYTFKNRRYGFRPDPINVDDDGLAMNYGRHKTVQVQINSAVDGRTCSAIAQRRAREDRTDRGAFEIRANRDARQLVPGDAFIITGVGQLRVGSTQVSFESGQVTLRCDLDEFSGLAGSYVPEDVDVEQGPAAFPPVPDVAVVALQVPGENRIVVGRVRGSSHVVAADVWVSPDGTTYQVAGEQDQWAAGGLLNEPMDDDPSDLSSGPSFGPFNGDVGEVLDLSGDATSWAAGVQLCLIDEEVMFLQAVLAVSGGYRLIGVKRGQMGTAVAAHATNAPVLIIERAALVSQYSPIMAPGATVYVKTQPKTASEAVDLSTVTAVTVTLT